MFTTKLVLTLADFELVIISSSLSFPAGSLDTRRNQNLAMKPHPPSPSSDSLQELSN